jgi:hypothetical protein
MEMRYEYGPDGRVVRISTVDQTSSDVSTYGPEKYVVEYQHDGMGRVARKIVRANTAEDTSVHYEAGYQFDGRGRLVNERILRWDDTAKKMRTTQEIRTTYDLGGNPTTIETFNDYGLVFSEARTYARGHQIKSFTLTAGPNSTITGATSGNYTYDTNNNLTGTPGTFTVTQNQDGTVRTMSFRQQWTFTFDRKNRMISFAKGSAPTERTNLWYDALGRVWQRWNDNPQTTDWAATAKRYVFDGSSLVQEHEFDVEEIQPQFKEGGGEGSEAMEEQPYWEYTYNKVLVDYLHQPGGLRQYRWDDDDEEYKTEFLMNDGGMPGARIERGTAIPSVSRAQRTASGDRQAEAEVTQFSDLSRMTASGQFIESYGGGTSGSTGGFDPLASMGARHYTAGLGRSGSRSGNNPYDLKGKIAPPGVPVGGGSGGLGGIPVPPFKDEKFKFQPIDPKRLSQGLIGGGQRKQAEPMQAGPSPTSTAPSGWPCSEDCWKKFEDWSENCFEVGDETDESYVKGKALTEFCCKDKLCTTVAMVADTTDCAGCICLDWVPVETRGYYSPRRCLCETLGNGDQRVTDSQFLYARDYCGCLERCWLRAMVKCANKAGNLPGIASWISTVGVCGDCLGLLGNTTAFIACVIDCILRHAAGITKPDIRNLFKLGALTCVCTELEECVTKGEDCRNLGLGDTSGLVGCCSNKTQDWLDNSDRPYPDLGGCIE